MSPSARSASRRADALREPRLREPRLRDRLATILATEIVSERLRPGEPFPSTDELVREYGVSRTVARETLQTLSMLKMVDVRHGKTTRVAESAGWDILSGAVQSALRRAGAAAPLLGDLYEFRLLIEPEAAALIAERASSEEVAELQALASRMTELASSGAELAPSMAADLRFHNLISRGTGNRVLAAVSRDIGELMTTLWSLSVLGPEELRAVATQHRAIADAISARKPSAARSAMREHLAWASKLDLKSLEQASPAS